MDLLDVTPERVRQMLEDPRALAGLVATLSPLVRLRVARVLRRAWPERAHGAHVLEVEDLSQDALLELFRDNGRVLRAWDPTRGLRLTSFAQLIAERVALTRLHGCRRDAARASAVQALEEDGAVDSAERPDHRAASRNRAELVLARLERRLSQRAVSIFRALFLEQSNVEALRTRFELTPDGLYAWRSRLTKQVHAVLQDLEPSSVPLPSRE